MDKREDLFDPEIAIWVVGATVMLGLAAYVVASWPLLLWSGGIPSLVDGVLSGVRVPWHLGEPRDAYPADLAAGLPGPVGWWAAVSAPAALLAVAGLLAMVRVDRWRGRRRLGVRRYDPRGRVRTRSFARPRDVRHLVCGQGEDSWPLVCVDRREIGTGPESHVLAIGPPRSGKSSALAIPWIVEAPGAVITTSTKRELAELAGPARSRVGPCWVYAPLAPREGLPVAPASWSPLAGCEDWDRAQLTAHWLADATPRSSGGGEDGGAARFWNAEAAKSLGAFLHAAALDPERFSMASVIGWVDAGAAGLVEPLDALGVGGHAAARSRLEGLAGQDARTLSYTLISAGQLIAAYRFEAVQASERGGRRVEVDELLDGNGTLFLIAPESRQSLVAPLFAALLGEVFRAIEERALTVGPLDPPARFVLDEAAQLAALASLPERLAVTSGQGVRIASLWQSLAQVRQRYGEDAETVVASSHARVVLGPVVDEPTRRMVVELLDEEPGERRSRHGGGLEGGRRSTTVQETPQRKASAQALQQLERWRGLAVVGSELPMVGRVAPWWERPRVAAAMRDEAPDRAR